MTKLSEMLRLAEGWMPGVHRQWIRMKGGKVCGGCAVGRVCVAAGYVPRSDSAFEVYRLTAFMDKTWPWTVEWQLKYPEPTRQLWGGIEPNPVMRVMSDLYEHNGWSMCKLADWVETIEPQEQPVQEVESAVQAVS